MVSNETQVQIRGIQLAPDYFTLAKIVRKTLPYSLQKRHLLLRRLPEGTSSTHG